MNSPSIFPRPHCFSPSSASRPVALAPPRCSREFDNSVVAGRCVGATHEAQASIRIMPICTCMGEAAGVAVALAKDTGVAPAEVDTDPLRDRLRAGGAFVGL